MRLQHVQSGDLIQVAKKGRHMYGKVLEIRDGVVEFEPLCRGVSYRHATAREIIAHWRRSGRLGPGPGDAADGARSAVPREQLALHLGT
jgi:hypothetical protein